MLKVTQLVKFPTFNGIYWSVQHLVTSWPFKVRSC